MRHVLPAALCALVLVLAGCGEEESGPLFDPGAMQDVAGGMNELGEQMEAGEIELTDDLMEEYVKIATEIRNDAKKGKASQVAILGKYGWSWGRWQATLLKVHAMSQTMSVGARPKLAHAIQGFENQMAAMKGKPDSEARLKRLETQRDSLQKALDRLPEANSLAAKNAAVLERWMPKIDAIDK